jgi:hypothetical protein
MNYSKENPSPEYIKLTEDYKKIHQLGTANQSPKETYNGISTVFFADILKDIIKINKCKTLLDYGSGKGDRYFNESFNGSGKKYPPLKDFWDVQPTFFDPGVPYKKPIGFFFDIVISIDVLEHIPYQDLGWVIDEIFKFSKDIVFINVACYSATAKLPNGKNAHVSIFNPWWWCGFVEAIASRYKIKTFLVCTYLENNDRTKPKNLSYSINDKFENYT